MAPAYQNVNSGQIVVSDEPRPDLEAQARWNEIPMPETDPEPTPPVAPPPVPVGEGDIGSGDESEDAGADDANGDKDDSVNEGNSDDQGESDTDKESSDSGAAPTPDETWTNEALDALGKKRGITWRSNTSKATKVAKLTATAAE